MGRDLLMLAHYFPPCGASGTFRSLGFARHLTRMGWNVTVLSASDYLSESRDPALLERVPDCVTVRNAPVWDPFTLWGKLKAWRQKSALPPCDAVTKGDQGAAAVGRLSLKDQATQLLKIPDNSVGWLIPALNAAAALPRPAVVYSSAPPFTSHLVGTFLKKRWGVPLVTDFRDPWGENPFRPALTGVARRWDSFLEGYVLKSSDLIIANTPQMEQGLRLRYPQHASKVRVITNGYDPEDFLDIKEQRDEPGGCILLIHPGSLYGQRNPLNFLRAVKEAVQRGGSQLRVQLIGPCENFEGKPLPQHVQELGLEGCVQLKPLVGHREVLALMKGADALLLFSQGTELQVPAKLFEYVALKKPILAVCGEKSATRDMLRQLPDPHFCVCNEVHEIAESLLMLVQALEHEEPLPAAALSSPFDRGSLTRELSGYLEQLVTTER